MDMALKDKLSILELGWRLIGARGHMQLLFFLMKKEKRSRLLAAFFVWDDISSCSQIKKFIFFKTIFDSQLSNMRNNIQSKLY